MSRNILIISNSTNTKQMISSNATTRAELEVELENAGINTKDMSFFEGLTRTDLVDANSQLPQRAMYKGQYTTDLIITLTPNSIKKVANGLMDRGELGAYIREHNLQDAVKREFGDNYTHIDTESLRTFVANDTKKCQSNSCAKSSSNNFVDFLKHLRDEITSMINNIESPTANLMDLDIDELMKEFGK